MNNSINNSTISFQAKMSLVGELAENARLQNVAREFESRTAKKYPNYEVKLQRTVESGKEKLAISINRGPDDDMWERGHVLNPDATKNFMDLSKNTMIQKLTKLLSLVKRRDNCFSNIEKDINAIEARFGGQLDDKTCNAMYAERENQVNSANLAIISKDSILSGFEQSHDIFSYGNFYS